MSTEHNDHEPNDPQLLPPQRLSPLREHLWLAPVVVAAGIGAALVVGVPGRGVHDAPAAIGTHSQRPHDPVVAVTSNTTGSFVLVDADVARDRPHAVRSLEMPETERQRVQHELQSGRIRIAAVTLWDNMDEDGDTVDVSAAGFTQRLVILNTPKTFFVPVVPGGTVKISAVVDGRGGGVTLSVRTALGPVPLPPLAAGQAIEVPAL